MRFEQKPDDNASGSSAENIVDFQGWKKRIEGWKNRHIIETEVLSLEEALERIEKYADNQTVEISWTSIENPTADGLSSGGYEPSEDSEEEVRVEKNVGEWRKEIKDLLNKYYEINTRTDLMSLYEQLKKILFGLNSSSDFDISLIEKK